MKLAIACLLLLAPIWRVCVCVCVCVCVGGGFFSDVVVVSSRIYQSVCCMMKRKLATLICIVTTIKNCLKRPKIGYQGRLSLNAGQKYCRMLQESILQYF